MQPCWAKDTFKNNEKIFPLNPLNSSAYKLTPFPSSVVLCVVISEARQQKSSDQISQLTPTSTSLTLSPFKTNPKTLKKGEEKKTEPTAADLSTAVLLKSTEKVKGQSYGLTTHTMVKTFSKAIFLILHRKYMTSVSQWKQPHTDLSHNSECCYLSSCCLDCAFLWCSL